MLPQGSSLVLRAAAVTPNTTPSTPNTTLHVPTKALPPLVTPLSFQMLVFFTILLAVAFYK
jgi:hypothetical protein